MQAIEVHVGDQLIHVSDERKLGNASDRLTEWSVFRKLLFSGTILPEGAAILFRAHAYLHKWNDNPKGGVPDTLNAGFSTVQFDPAKQLSISIQ